MIKIICPVEMPFGISYSLGLSMIVYGGDSTARSQSNMEFFFCGTEDHNIEIIVGELLLTAECRREVLMNWW
ncbi:hypothetical protein XELAEV_18038356mg [Xenopus laevis]|uniref:Uncharacterized protein n=1 Tax=Xenopus laevis TaxID=8355 RepID=A0A974C5H9_XENLA|nr:hypothetical protein XELAEV_18038356mg [Xenopus laevis]